MTSEEKYIYDRARALFDECRDFFSFTGTGDMYRRGYHLSRIEAMYDGGYEKSAYFEGRWKPSAGPRSVKRWFYFFKKRTRVF